MLNPECMKMESVKDFQTFIMDNAMWPKGRHENPRELSSDPEESALKVLEKKLPGLDRFDRDISTQIAAN